MPEQHDRRAARRLPGDPQAGCPPRGGGRRRRLRADARRRPRQLPEVPAGRRQRHLPQGRPRHPPAARRRLRRRARRLQRPVPRRPALHRLLDEALATKFLPWSEAYLQLCVDGWAAEVAKRYGAETMAEIEWAAWNDQIVPELERMQNEFLPAGTVYDDPNQQVRRGPTRTTRVVYTGLVHAPARRRRARPSPSWSRGSSGATSTCCSASRRGRRRSPCATALDEMFDIQ